MPTMATLARAYLRVHPSAQTFHSTRSFTHRNRQMSNTNALLGSVRGVNGLKTGWTVASGYNLIVTAQRGNTRLLAVVMGGSTRNARDAMYDICKSILPKAKAVVNIGTCACYGGVQAAKPNPTAAKGVNECFADLGIKGINIPGCPPNPLNMGRRGKAQPRPNLLAA